MSKHNKILKWVHVQLTDTTLWDTLNLITQFSIPLGHHLVIDNMIFNMQVSGSQRIEWDKAFVEDTGITNEFISNEIRIFVAVGQTTIQFTQLGIEVFDEFRYVEITADTVDISIGFFHKKGEMRFQDDIAEQVAEIRKIGQIETQAGHEFHRVGDVRVLNVFGEDVA